MPLDAAPACHISRAASPLGAAPRAPYRVAGPAKPLAAPTTAPANPIPASAPVPRLIPAAAPTRTATGFSTNVRQPLPGIQPTGSFSVHDGQIYAPDGSQFEARGFNVSSGQVDAATILSTFPNGNAIRLATTPGADPGQIDALVAPLTAAGWVVLIEDHSSSGAAYSGGNNVLTGQALADEAGWYGSLAAKYRSNPNVWFGTANEPDNPNDLNSIVRQHTAIYDAVRGANSNAIVALETRGGFTNDAAAASASAYASMKNVVWDTHFYGWVNHENPDPSSVFNAFGNQIANAQSVRSGDGLVPVVVGEYGPSSSGLSASDANGTVVIDQVLHSKVGGFAWAWNAGTDALTTGYNTLTDFGRQVSAYFNANAKAKP